MKRWTGFSLALFFSLLPLGLQSAEINSIQVRLEENATYLEVYGSEFDVKGPPAAMLSDELGILQIELDTELVDANQLNLYYASDLLPGQYKLVLQNNRGKTTGSALLVIGAVGPQGPEGPAGPEGSAGQDGAVGPQGPEGPRGLQGERGLAGTDGQDGAPGADGQDGATGPEGPAGPAGARGEQGPQGPQGELGVAGTDGQDGAPGADGQDGATGPVGVLPDQSDPLGR